MINIPYDCPRGLDNCIALSIIESDDKTSFFCCGENNGEGVKAKQDIYTTCFKGALRDEISHSDKRDLVHQASVIMQSLAVVQAFHGEERDWSPWKDLNNE